MAVGTWNTDLEPWLPNQADVIDTIAASHFDVLGLQGVWSDAAAQAITSDPRIAARYPYSYAPPPQPDTASCPIYVPVSVMTNFINSVVNAGIDPRQFEQPTTDLPDTVVYEAVNLSLISQPCYATLVNALQNLPAGADPLSVIAAAQAGQTPKYAHGGSTGQLILSDRPLQDTSTTYFDTYEIERANIYATVAGVRIGFAAWPRNALADYNPEFAPLQNGRLQLETAMDVVNQHPDLVIGSFNSGSDDTQPEGASYLTKNGFVPQFAQPTYCPTATHADDPACRPQRSVFPQPTNTSIDDVYAGSGTRCENPAAFATTQQSDHIGVAAVCAVTATVARPVVTGVSPAAGPSSGGQQITITGTGLSGATRLVFGTTRTTDFTVDSDTQITATTPARSTGVVKVRVHTLGGLSAKSPAGRYSYQAP